MTTTKCPTLKLYLVYICDWTTQYHVINMCGNANTSSLQSLFKHDMKNKFISFHYSSTVNTYRDSVSGGFQRQQQFGIRSCYIVHFYQIGSGYDSLQLCHTHPAQFLQLFLTHFTCVPLLYINLGDIERRKFGSGIYD